MPGSAIGFILALLVAAGPVEAGDIDTNGLAHLQALRDIEGGIMAAVYYQESRVDTYPVQKNGRNPRVVSRRRLS